MGMQALIFSFKGDYEEFDDVSAAFTNVCLKADSPVSSPVVARCSLSHDLVVGFQVDKLKEAALCALHALPAICALGDNWRAWRALRTWRA